MKPWPGVRERIDRLFSVHPYNLLIRNGAIGPYEWLLEMRHRLWGRKIRIDASTVCQLRCAACSTANGKNRRGVVGRGHLKPNHFRRLLDDNPDIREVELSNWGEIFLNPKIKQIIRLAHERGVRLEAANGVNLNTVKRDVLRALVEYRFRFLSVSIDGASPETYALYRRRGDFNRVIENIRIINYYKKKLNSGYPVLSWQFVIFGHNEHEIPRARELAAELDMRFRTKLNHTPAISPVQNVELIRRQGGHGAVDRDDYKSRKKREYSFPCSQLWSNPQINWNGKLLGCCVNKYGSFGNVFKTGLQTALNDPRYRYARLMVLGRAPPAAGIPCTKCRFYHRLHPGSEFDRNRSSLSSPNLRRPPGRAE